MSHPWRSLQPTNLCHNSNYRTGNVIIKNFFALGKMGPKKEFMMKWKCQTLDTHLMLFTDPEGDSCFSIKFYQIRWIKMKRITFGKLKMSLNGNFVYNNIYKHFRDFVKWLLRLLLQIQHENNFLATNKHQQAKVHHFSGISLYDYFIYRSNSIFRKCLEMRCHLGSGCKTVNSQGYSELREPIKTDENCFSLIW